MTPRTTAETLEMLRFRLGKSIPFDAEAARIAFERVPGSEVDLRHRRDARGRGRASTKGSSSELGLHVGFVLPGKPQPPPGRAVAWRGSTWHPDSDFFLVNVESDYFTVSLVRDRDKLALVRTLGRRASRRSDGGFGRLRRERSDPGDHPHRDVLPRAAEGHHAPARLLPQRTQ